MLDSFFQSLFTLLPFDFYLYSTDFEVHPMPLRLFYESQKSFDELQCSFCKVFILKMFLCFISH